MTPSYLTQDQFDTLGQTELRRIIDKGMPYLVATYHEFIEGMFIPSEWRKLCCKYAVEIPFHEQDFFKSWLIITSVKNTESWSDIYHLFMSVVIMDYKWRTDHDSRPGLAAEAWLSNDEL